MKVSMIVALLGAGALSSAGAPAADLYKGKCVMCHGADGSGATPMGKKLNLKDLRSPEVQGQTDAQLSETIENGKGKMPGQKDRLSKDEIRDLAGHVRALSKR
jgi:mono/diheme cytochrome c family protein